MKLAIAVQNAVRLQEPSHTKAVPVRRLKRFKQFSGIIHISGVDPARLIKSINNYTGKAVFLCDHRNACAVREVYAALVVIHRLSIVKTVYAHIAAIRGVYVPMPVSG